MKKMLAVFLFGFTGGAGLAADAGPASFDQAQLSADVPVVQVKEADGVYSVHARFSVPQPAAVVRAVLTDYEGIPRFVPDMKKSVVQGRGESTAVVEQEAVSKLMMFSKTVHLVLEIRERPGEISFRDGCGRSFSSYAGAWQFTERDGRTVLVYTLTAKPSFDVPGFILKRLMKRDADGMIERLQREFASRASARMPSQDDNASPGR